MKSPQSPATTGPSPATARVPARVDRQEVASWIAAACRAVHSGRRSAAMLAEWAEGAGLTEFELRLLWALYALEHETGRGPTSAVDSLRLACDQRQLAERLVASPAQISATVAKLQESNLLFGHRPRSDRRRQIWRISDQGRAAIEQIIQFASEPSPPRRHPAPRNSHSPQEAA
ncbi:MAG: winged helix-turn-helix transcriptional regulator [Planctomycetales bacterium]|nr:winged helix-turn-helix transcriptional regulator [Planctomycetales bacterium]